MKILIITPSYFPKITGNTVFTKRIVLGLEKLNNEVMIIAPENLEIEKIKKFKPEVIHALHAYRSRIVMKLSMDFNIPYVITLTGSDYEECLKDSLKREVTLEIMKKSSALVAGVRIVKNNLFAINALEPLQKKYNKIKLILVGPILDRQYNNLLKEMIKGKDWTKYIGIVSIEKMKGVYESSDIILNCSHYEGESNALVEAMFFGKPLLASDIEANIAIVKDKINGITYKKEDKTDFLNKAEKMYKDNALLKRISKKAKIDSKNIINSNEAKDYHSLYLKVLKEFKN